MTAPALLQAAGAFRLDSWHHPSLDTQALPAHTSIDIYRASMSKANPDVLQGTLDLLILKCLMRGPMHGYGIAVHIQQVSGEVLRVEEGSLYPALHRIEQAGWISSEWGTSDNNRRAKYYRLSAVGRKQLAKEEENWDRLTRAVAKVLRFA
jgi:PadR family transcriptional regulator PadR